MRNDSCAPSNLSSDDCRGASARTLTALACAFLSRHHPTTIWNRSQHTADDLVREGADRAGSVPDAVSASDLVVVCLHDDEAVREVLSSAGDRLRCRVIVNLTTGTPDQARQMAGWVIDRGADHVDGVIMASRLVRRVHSPPADARRPRRHEPRPDRRPGRSDAVPGSLHAFALIGSAGIDAATFRLYAAQWSESVVAVDDPAAMAAEVDARKYPDPAPASGSTPPGSVSSPCSRSRQISPSVA